MKKKIIFIYLIFIVALFQTAAETLLKVPVRVFENKKYVTGLKAEDFSLEINGVKRNIEMVLELDRDLDVSEKSRTFILHFDLTEYGENILKGITYFTDNILNKKDSVILWSPLKIYRIKTNQDRKKIIHDIETLVKKDSLVYKNFRKGAKDKLTSILNKFLNSSENAKDPGSLTTKIIFFLNNYSREWLDFKKKYIVPNMGKYYGLISMLTYKYPGEKYFFTFQQREIIPSLRKLQRAKKIISDYLSSIAGTLESTNAASISTAVKTIDRSMLLTDNFKPEMLASPFLGANISFNTIFFNSFRQTGRDSDDLSPDYEGVLRDLSNQTGGLSVNTNDIEEGLRQIRKKRDNYYNIIFKFNGKKGEKKISITSYRKKYKMAYLKKFHKEEIDNLLKLAREKKIEISNYSLAERKLSFDVEGFKFDGKKEKFGIIRITIGLFDKNNKMIFSKSNTLRAAKKNIKISLKLAPWKKGFFKLQITTDDLKASRTAALEKYIELK